MASNRAPRAPARSPGSADQRSDHAGDRDDRHHAQDDPQGHQAEEYPCWARTLASRRKRRTTGAPGRRRPGPGRRYRPLPGPGGPCPRRSPARGAAWRRSRRACSGDRRRWGDSWSTFGLGPGILPRSHPDHYARSPLAVEGIFPAWARTEAVPAGGHEGSRAPGFRVGWQERGFANQSRRCTSPGRTQPSAARRLGCSENSESGRFALGGSSFASPNQNPDGGARCARPTLRMSPRPAHFHGVG
jgi:hypothetical protein